jgi:hypothetical protein
MGEAKRKADALKAARLDHTYVNVKDLKGLKFPVQESPEGDLIITDGPYTGVRVRVPR